MTPRDDLTKIAEAAAFAKKHVNGIADNTKRRVVDEDSWYIGMIQGRQYSLEWAVRELQGKDHYDAGLEILEDDIAERLREGVDRSNGDLLE